MARPLYREKRLIEASHASRVETHLAAGEWAFALEAAIRGHEQINDEGSELLLRKTLECFNDGQIARPRLVALQSLLFFARALCGMDNDQRLKKDILTIRRLVDKSISRVSDFHESYLFIMGRSPLDPHIRRPLERKFEEFARTGTIHDDCCLCFARLGASGVLANAYPEHVTKIAAFLKAKQGDQYRSQAGQLRDWRYTSKTLLFATLLGDRAWADEIFDLILKSEDWLECSEGNSILERGGVIHSALQYCTAFGLDPRSVTGFARIEHEFSCLVREIGDMRAAPISLDGLIGLVSFLRAELNHGRRDEALEGMVENQIEFMRTNTLWDKQTGTWGFEKQRTNYRIELWLEYTEWKCQLRKQ